MLELFTQRLFEIERLSFLSLHDLPGHREFAGNLADTVMV